MDLDTFKSMHSQKARVIFGNFPAAEGPDQIAGAIGQFWSTHPRPEAQIHQPLGSCRRVDP